MFCGNDNAGNYLSSTKPLTRKPAARSLSVGVHMNESLEEAVLREVRGDGSHGFALSASNCRSRTTRAS